MGSINVIKPLLSTAVSNIKNSEKFLGMAGIERGRRVRSETAIHCTMQPRHPHPHPTQMITKAVYLFGSTKMLRGTRGPVRW